MCIIGLKLNIEKYKENEFRCKKEVLKVNFRFETNHIYICINQFDVFLILNFQNVYFVAQHLSNNHE